MTIWNLQHIDNYYTVKETAFPIISAKEYKEYRTSNTLIAIVGGGPKGFYGLDALITALYQSSEVSPLEIHWFNQSDRFASGDNYRLDQAEYLLINFPIGKINIWKTSSMENGPLAASFKLSMLDWLRKFKIHPSDVKKTSYSSRALVGAYLKDGAIQLLKHLPPFVKVRCIVDSIEDIDVSDEKDKYWIRGAQLGVNKELRYSHILLATGHAYSFGGEQTQQLVSFARQSEEASFIGHIYPVEDKLKYIKTTDRVGIKGMGLTFIDTALALSEGREGRFEGNGKDFHYLPSGKEPLSMYAFSKTGAPMLPRVPHSAHEYDPLVFISNDWVEGLIRKKGKGRIDFEEDIWPVLEMEYRICYYKRRMLEQGHPDFAWPKDISSTKQLIAGFLEEYPQTQRFSLEKILCPFQELENINGEEYHFTVINYLESAINEALEAPGNSPLGLSDVWRKALPHINQLYSFGGFSGEAQQKFDSQYLGKMNRISFGPPLINTQKVLALAKAGLLFFRLGRDTHVSPHALTGKFRIYSQQTNYCKEVKVLVDARIPKPMMAEGCPSIYRNLIEKGLAIPFKNNHYLPGCLAIGKRGNVINNKGDILPGITLYGTPTEGVTLDNDSLSRDRNDFVSLWSEGIVHSLFATKRNLVMGKQ
ncbi:MAG: FAD/NAD(P)-binding protein [Cyclobacteriaceae bacterium]